MKSSATRWRDRKRGRAPEPRYNSSTSLRAPSSWGRVLPAEPCRVKSVSFLNPAALNFAITNHNQKNYDPLVLGVSIRHHVTASQGVNTFQYQRVNE